MERKEEENGRETRRKKRGWGGKWRGRRKEKSKKGEDRKGRGLWSGKGKERRRKRRGKGRRKVGRTVYKTGGGDGTVALKLRALAYGCCSFPRDLPVCNRE